MSAQRQKPKPKAQRGGGGMGEFYRVNRMLHAYFSAFAFLALIFFSVTGILLNHPDWLEGERPEETVRMIAVPQSEIQAAMATDKPEDALARAVLTRSPVLGRFLTGEVIDNEALLQFSGPRGETNVTLLVDTGTAEVAVRPARMVTFLNDLHTGKNAGPVWKAAIDVVAILVIILSLIGYVLFFSLRFRLRTSLVLTGVSLAVMVALVWLFVA